MARSGCFQVVDRGAASEALQRERQLAAQGELREGSDMGGGQLVAADYLVTPNILFQDPNAGGSNVGGILGGLLPGMLGAVAGSIRSTSLEAPGTPDPHQRPLRRPGSRGRGFRQQARHRFQRRRPAHRRRRGGPAAVAPYTSTDIGKIVMVAFVDGLNKLVAQIG